jgi:hypothetical protein
LETCFLPSLYVRSLSSIWNQASVLSAIFGSIMVITWTNKTIRGAFEQKICEIVFD